MEKKLTGYARFKPLQEELAALKAENEALTERAVQQARELLKRKDYNELKKENERLKEDIISAEAWTHLAVVTADNKIKQLQADKAELVEALKELFPSMVWGNDPLFYKKIQLLLSKHSPE